MAAHRYVKPFIVAGLTGALSLGAPMAAFAVDSAISTDQAPVEETTLEADSNVSVQANPSGNVTYDFFIPAGNEIKLGDTWVAESVFSLYVYGDPNYTDGTGLPFGSYEVVSSDPSIVSLSVEDGVCLLKALKPGKVTLTAMVGGVAVDSLELTIPDTYLDFVERTSAMVLTSSNKVVVTAGYQPSDTFYGDVTAVSYDLANGPASMTVYSSFSEPVKDFYVSESVTSSNPSVALASEYVNGGGTTVEFIGEGSAVLTVETVFNINDERVVANHTIQVTVTDSSATETPENPSTENPPAETEQPKDEQKPQDTTDNKDKSDGEGLPETGDPAFVAMGIAGLAGVGAVAAGVRSRRRED